LGCVNKFLAVQFGPVALLASSGNDTDDYDTAPSESAATRAFEFEQKVVIHRLRKEQH
jgi:hypothetical protein